MNKINVTIGAFALGAVFAYLFYLTVRAMSGAADFDLAGLGVVAGMFGFAAAISIYVAILVIIDRW